MTTEVTVYGPLADYLGRSKWSFSLEWLGEVFQALEANTDKIVPFFRDNPLMQYRIVVNGGDVAEGALFARGLQFKTVELVPIVAASGNAGTWLAIIGIAIVALVLAPGVGGAFGTLAAGGSLSTGTSFLLTMGVALTLAGVSQMLFGTPGAEILERGDNKPSYLFNGAVNTYSQGNPVPVGFGRLRIGSQVISVGIRSVDIIDVASE